MIAVIVDSMFYWRAFETDHWEEIDHRKQGVMIEIDGKTYKPILTDNMDQFRGRKWDKVIFYNCQDYYIMDYCKAAGIPTEEVWN